MSAPQERKGTCSLCGGRCTYKSYRSSSFWIHDETGDFQANFPVRHDCNTYIVRDES